MAAAVVDVESLFTDVGQVQKALERLDVHKDANEIYELLETHSFRTDRVQFVTSQLLYTLRVRNGLFEDDYNDEDHNGVDKHSVISISDDSSLDGMKDSDIKCENLLYSLSPEYEIPQMNDSEALDLTVPNDQNVSVSENSKEKEGEHSNATSHNDSFEPEVKNSNASPNYSLEPEDGTSKCLLNTYLRELDHFAVSVENVEKETEAAIATILDGFETGSGINMTDNDETKSQGAEESNYPAEQINFLYDVNNNDPNNNTEYEVPLEEVERERGSKLTVEEPDESDLEFQDQDDIRAKLLAEAKLIHRIVPKQNLEQIYSYLEANLDNKSRLQIVMQEFLKMELLPETHAVPSESAQETNALYNEISYEGTDTSSGNAVPGLNSKPQPSTSKDYTKDSTLEIDPCASSNVMEPESELKLLPTAICDSVDSDSKMLNRDDVNHSTNTSLVLENSSDRLSELPGTSAVEQIPIKTSEQGVQIDDDYDEEIDILTIHVNDETSHNKKNAYNEIPIINTIGHMLPPPEQSQRNPRSLLKKRQKIANAKAIPKIAPAMICKNKNKGDRKKKIPHLNDAGAKAIPKIAPSMIFKNKNKGDKKKKMQSTFPCLNDARLCNLEKKTPLKNILPDDNKNKIKRVTFKLPADDRLIPDRKKNVKRMTFNIPADNIRPPDDKHLPDRKEKVKRVTFPVDNIRPLHVPLWDDDSGDDSDDDSDDSLLLSHKRYTQSNTAKKMKRLNEIFQKETVDDSDDDALLLGHKPYTQSNTDKFIENLTQMKDLTDRLERKRKSDDAVDSSPDKNRKIGETSINIPEPELNADQIRYKLTLLEMFPDADPNFLFEMCRKIFDEVAFDDLINRMLQKNYPVRDLPERMPAENLDDPQPGPSRSAKDKTEDIEAQYKILLAILPNADPSYLRQQCENLIGDENKMKAFVSDALENKVYPTKEEYIKRQEALALQKKYTEQFSVEAFLEIIPNPFKYFYEEKVNTEAGFNIVLPYLKSRYKRIRQSDICNELKRNNYSLARTCDRLDQFYGLSRKSKRGEYECRMLEEVAFIENKNKIRKFLEDKKRLKEKKFEEGLLKPSIFSRMLQRKQLEEVKAAGIEDLESCPFCDFASIPPRGDKIFKCLNPDCMRESCRLCKEPNHIPLRCEEVEKPAEVKARTYIEDRMTEALVR
ncbi:hypothetical protein C0J52_16651 [Blattella germanica]|nr:hypothetical protein C0J52_16651 [Blattella germanica]